MHDEIFNLIKSEYNNYYNSFLRKGRLPMRTTEKGFWSASHSDEVYGLFKRINLSRFNNFLDLGSGDGKVALVAGLFCKNSEGVEIDTHLHFKALEMKRKFNAGNVHFHKKDFLTHDLRSYDIIFLSPDSPLERGVEKKLLNELNGKLLVFGNHFHPKILRRETSFFAGNNLASFYSRP